MKKSGKYITGGKNRYGYNEKIIDNPSFRQKANCKLEKYNRIYTSGQYSKISEKDMMTMEEYRLSNNNNNT